MSFNNVLLDIAGNFTNKHQYQLSHFSSQYVNNNFYHGYDGNFNISWPHSFHLYYNCIVKFNNMEDNIVTIIDNIFTIRWQYCIVTYIVIILWEFHNLMNNIINNLWKKHKGWWRLPCHILVFSWELQMAIGLGWNERPN